MALDTTPTMASQVPPFAIAAVSGIPAKASRNNVKTPASSGERRARPAHCDRCVASPALSRTSVTTAKAPMVVKP